MGAQAVHITEQPALVGRGAFERMYRNPDGTLTGDGTNSYTYDSSSHWTGGTINGSSPSFS